MIRPERLLVHDADTSWYVPFCSPYLGRYLFASFVFDKNMMVFSPASPQSFERQDGDIRKPRDPQWDYRLRWSVVRLLGFMASWFMIFEFLVWPLFCWLSVALLIYSYQLHPWRSVGCNEFGRMRAFPEVGVWLGNVQDVTVPPWTQNTFDRNVLLFIQYGRGLTRQVFAVKFWLTIQTFPVLLRSVFISSFVRCGNWSPTFS